jgi:hypothetical protein
LLCAPTRRVQKRRCLTRTTTTTTLTTTTTTTITTAASSPPPHGPVRPASLDSRFFGACPALPCPALVLALLPDRGTRFYLGPFCSSPGACYQRPALPVSNLFHSPSHHLMSRHPYRARWGLPSHPLHDPDHPTPVHFHKPPPSTPTHSTASYISAMRLHRYPSTPLGPAQSLTLAAAPSAVVLALLPRLPEMSHHHHQLPKYLHGPPIHPSIIHSSIISPPNNLPCHPNATHNPACPPLSETSKQTLPIVHFSRHLVLLARLHR